jgi:peptidoglycan-associated lipoprotein
MRKFVVTCCAVMLLAACGTTVPLSEVPVTDASPKVVSGADVNADGTGVKGSGVAPVDLGAGSIQANTPSEPRIVYFDHDSFVIKPEFQSLIAGHARFAKAQPPRRLAIEGHTDETGGREYNLALGQKRAEAVRDALAILGVSSTQMEAVSFGKEKPAVAGNDEAAFSKNRRAEIRYQ